MCWYSGSSRFPGALCDVCDHFQFAQPSAQTRSQRIWFRSRGHLSLESNPASLCQSLKRGERQVSESCCLSVGNVEHKERCCILGKGTLVASRAKAGGLWQVEPSQRRIARAGPVLGAVLVGYACACVCVCACVSVCGRGVTRDKVGIPLGR